MWERATPAAVTGRVLRILGVALACAIVACASAPVPAPNPAAVDIPAAMPPAPPAPDCRAARGADFKGDGEQQLRRYLAWLVQAHGAKVSLKPEDVTLAIARGEPKPSTGGVTAGEVSCSAGKYRVTLYRNVLDGRPLAVAYESLAHEFYHVVQIRLDRLKCKPGKGDREGYEREAVEFARTLVPACTE